MLNRAHIIFLAAFSIPIILIISSCSKTDPTTAIIIVKDTSNNPINKAFVTLSIDPDLRSNQGEHPQSSLNRTEETDSQGKAEFTYDLEVILDINVVKYSGNDTLIGSGVIALLQGETKTEKITVFNY